MPEAAIVWLGEAIATAGWVEAGSMIADYAWVIQAVSAVYTLREQQIRSETRAKNAYNGSLRDRYAMVRSAVDARQLVLGRQRVSGPVGFIQSYGAQREHLVYTVVLAAHELDAIETVYFNDEPVTLDSAGNVTGILRTDSYSIAATGATVTLSTLAQAGSISATAQYGSSTVALTVGIVTGTSVSVSGAHAGETGLLVIKYQPDPCPFVPNVTTSVMDVFSPGGSGTDVFTLSKVPVPGSVLGSQTTGQGDAVQFTNFTPALAGSVATFAGLVGGSTVSVAYQTTSANSRARVTKYLGAPGQQADAAMMAALPGVWTAGHTGTDLAYLKVELDYDQNSFPGGIPSVSAVVRGLKCFDPRAGVTAWSENPALLLRAYALHPLGGRLQAGQVDDASINSAATVCDVSTAYTVGGKAYTRPLYRAGHVAKSGVRPSDVLTDLAHAMGGRWCIVDGTLKVKAGSYTSPVQPLDESWLHEGGAVQIQPRRNRADVVNVITGTFANETASYKVAPFPKISAAAYIAEDGRELPADLAVAAATWSGQVQYIAACNLRYARQGVTIKLTCNMRAYQLEPFDVITVSLGRFGWAAKNFEVLDASWTLTGGIDLTLKEIDPSIWTMDAGFAAVDPAPNTRLPSPWGVPLVTGLSASSTAATVQRQADGSKVSRILATWAAVNDPRITQNGAVELRWGLATEPEAKWATVACAGAATSAYLSPVHTGSSYLVKARTISQAAASDWCAHVLCAVINTAAFGGAVDFDAVIGGNKPANSATSDVSLVVTGAGLVLTGNSVFRATGGGAWDSQCYSRDGYTGGAACSFSAQASNYFIAGLSADPTANASYDLIPYGYMVRTGVADYAYADGAIYDLGVTSGAGDVCSVTYDGQFVRYARNGTVLRTKPAAPGQTLFFDSSVLSAGIKNIRFGPYQNSFNSRAGNLIDASWWSPAQSPHPKWASSGAGTDSFVVSTLPDGASGIVLKAVSDGTSGTSPGGGWDHGTAGSPTNSFPVDPNKTYMFVVYTKSVSGTGQEYWGIDTASVCYINTTTPHTNPYFSSAPKVNGMWHMHVGWVYPAGTTGHVAGKSGAYNCVTGAFITGLDSFCWKSDTQRASTRSFQYYQTPAAEELFAWPAVYLCDGSEPSVDDLLSMSVKGNIVAATAAAAVDAAAKAAAAQANAISTAAAAAQAKADAAVVTANAYADGIVTPAEARAIAAAQVKADAAQAAATAAAAVDASAKAALAALTAKWSGVNNDNGLRPQDGATVGGALGGGGNITGQAITNQIAANAIINSASGTVTGTGRVTGVRASATEQVTIASITTDASGSGKVMLWLSPISQPVLNNLLGYLAECSISPFAATTIKFELFRNSTVIFTQTSSTTPTDTLTRMLWTSLFLDSPGAGVACTYALKVTGTRNGADNIAIEICSFNYVIMDIKR